MNFQEEFKNKISSDQTGRFPYRSFKGNQYVMIIHESDSNAIFYEPVTNKESGSNVKAWTTAMQRFKKCGITPKHQVMDNEVSNEWKEAIEEADMTYQLAPPDGHAKDTEKGSASCKGPSNIHTVRDEREIPNTTLGQITAAGRSNIEHVAAGKSGA